MPDERVLKIPMIIWMTIVIIAIVTVVRKSPLVIRQDCVSSSWLLFFISEFQHIEPEIKMNKVMPVIVPVSLPVQVLIVQCAASLNSRCKYPPVEAMSAKLIIWCRVRNLNSKPILVRMQFLAVSGSCTRIQIFGTEKIGTNWNF